MKAELAASLCDALDVRPGMLVGIVGAGGKTSLMYGLGRELAHEGHPALLTTTTRIWFPSGDQVREVVLGEESDATVAEIRSRFERAGIVVAGRVKTDDGPGGKIAGFAPSFVETIGRGDSRWTVVAECDGAAGRSLKVPRQGEPPVAESTDLYVVMIGGDCFGAQILSRDVVFNPESVAAVAGVNSAAQVDSEVVVRSVASEDSYLGRKPEGARCAVFINKIGVEGFEQSGEDSERNRVTDAFATGLELKEVEGIERVVLGSLERGSGRAFLVFR